MTSACNHLFYYPSQATVLTPSKLQIDYKEIKIPSADEVTLAAWWLMPPEAQRLGRLVVHLHGNAENMTTHFLYVAWLVSEGYDVVTWDYRGYGQSSPKSPTQAGLIRDTCAVLRWIEGQKPLQKLPMFVVAQSLGGAVAAASLPKCPPPQLKGVVFDSTFSSYRQIARAKLADIWLTWPLQYPLSYLVSDEEDLTEEIAKIRVPVLFFHSLRDPVVPYKLGQELFAAAADPKEFVSLKETGHTRALAEEASQEKLVEFFDATLQKN
jgi:alpha-beta hydrolase superfamily lysophospholipase